MSAIQEVFVAHAGPDRDLAVVGATVDLAAVPTSVEALLRRRARLLGTDPPLTALSYHRTSDDHAVVLHRFRDEKPAAGTSGRNRARALVGTADDLPADVALGLDGWSGWRRSDASSGPDPAELRVRHTARADLDVRARCAPGLAVVLAALLENPQAGLTVVGRVTDGLALLWGVYRLGSAQPSLAHRRWTFSTYEVDERDDPPEIVLVPVPVAGAIRPPGRGRVDLGVPPPVPDDVAALVARYRDGAEPAALPRPDLGPDLDPPTDPILMIPTPAVDEPDLPPEPAPEVARVPAGGPAGPADPAAPPGRVTRGGPRRVGPARPDPREAGPRRPGAPARRGKPWVHGQRPALALAAAAGGAAALVAAAVAFWAGLQLGRLAPSAADPAEPAGTTAAATAAPDPGGDPPTATFLAGSLVGQDRPDEPFAIAGRWSGLTADDRLVLAVTRDDGPRYITECTVLLMGEFRCTDDVSPANRPTVDRLVVFRLSAADRAELDRTPAEQKTALLTTHERIS